MVPNPYATQVGIPPWSTPGLWREATESLAAAASRPGVALASAASLARGVAQCIADLDGTMGTLCAACCPNCRHNCCHRATVWYDFKDLIFLHIKGMTPQSQILRPSRGPCPHSGRRGCLLPRVARPYICTWYLCPDLQTALMGLPADIKSDFEKSLVRLKNLRQEMENAFVAALFG